MLGQDQPILFQFPVMIADGTGRSLSFAGAPLRIFRELFNLLPEIAQHGTTIA
jgi:hypothetical protein